jgi:hypothetical protein
MHIGKDLLIGDPRAKTLLDPEASGTGCALRMEIIARDLAPLRAPLYLLHALDWLAADGLPSLPAALKEGLLPITPAEVLRQISADVEDRHGFVALEPAARRLCSALYGRQNGDLAAWMDREIGAAIHSGRIEVHEWASGQPRHGRGLFGDRNRKLVRWTVHDNFLPAGAPR